MGPEYPFTASGIQLSRELPVMEGALGWEIISVLVKSHD